MEFGDKNFVDSELKRPQNYEMGKMGGISGQQVLQRLEGMRSLPILSPIVLDLQDRIKSSKLSNPDLAELLSRDQVISARVLRLANSSFYGLSNPVSSLQKAAQYVGENNILALLATSESVKFDPKNPHSLVLRKNWEHSIRVAKIAEDLAVICRPKLAHEALAAGLIHDIGKLSLQESLPDLAMQIIRLSEKETLTPLQAELKLGLLGHPVYGEYLAKNWRLPPIISKAVRYHHKDIQELTLLSDQEKDVVRITSLANFIEKYGSNLPEGSVESRYARDLGLSKDHLSSLHERVEKELEPLINYYFRKN
jgi:HD-like signal output (HDOD) protein